MSIDKEYCKCYLKYEVLSVTPLDLLIQIKQIFSRADNEFVFITDDDDVYVFGNNSWGRLGMGNAEKVPHPVKLIELSGKGVRDIQFGDVVMVALTKIGDVYITGYDYRAGLFANGQNIRKCYVKPEKINFTSVKSIKTCGYGSVYLVTDNDQLFWFGSRQSGESALSPTNMDVLSGEKITKIACGHDFILALIESGQVYSWGYSEYGELGLGADSRSTPEPQLLDMGNTKIIKITCGRQHSLLLAADGSINSFGYNEQGQLGTGDTVLRNRPQSIFAGTKFCEIFASGNLSLAKSKDNKIYMWGLAGTDNKILTPELTDFKTFQEAIDKFRVLYTIKPMSSNLIFNTKELNPVLKTMKKAFNTPKNSDIKFHLKSVEDNSSKYIYGHKWYIEETSDYFKAMFSNQWKENEENIIEIKGHTYEGYYQFIRCLYLDNIESDDVDVLVDLLSICDEYMETNVKTKCVQKLKPLIDTNNSCTLYACSLKYNSKELQDFVFKYMTPKMSFIVNTEDFQQMPSEYAKELFKRYCAWQI